MTINYAAHNKDRIRRAESWLEEAKKPNRSDLEVFLFCWIAFNAAYGKIPEEGVAEWRLFNDFARDVAHRDTENTIKTALDTDYAATRRLMKNKHIYEPFWKSKRGDEDDWEEEFHERNKRIWDQWSKNNISGMLNEILSRLYTLRNQVIHGGVTFSGGYGEKQLASGSRMMILLVPRILSVMQATIQADPDTKIWGEVAYPRYKEHEQNKRK